jgi:hypothetical protein
MAHAVLLNWPGSSGPYTGIDLQKNKAMAGVRVLIGRWSKDRAMRPFACIS